VVEVDAPASPGIGVGVGAASLAALDSHHLPLLVVSHLCQSLLDFFFCPKNGESLPGEPALGTNTMQLSVIIDESIESE
jgi:hypothetical protein